MNARPLVRKPIPRVIPDKVDVASTNATIYLVDIYKGEGLKGFPRGSIKKLRIGTYNYRHFGNGFTYAAAYEGGWDIKRIIGEVDVTPNGSAFFSVPANTPIFVQPLDAEGKAQALMRSWYNTMPGEIGSCVGCHESQNTTPPTEINDLTRLPPQKPTPFYGGERAYSFEREVQPILNRRCVGCHDEKAEKEKGRPDFRDKRLRPPEKELVARGCSWWGWLGPMNRHLKKEGDHFSPAYWRLQRYVRRAGLEADYHILPPAEFEADTSYLVQLLKLGHYGVELNEEEWRKLYTWIDFNVPYYATYSESSMPPDPVNIAKRVKYDKLYSNKDNHDEDPVSVPPIEAFTPPTKKSVKPNAVKSIELPNNYKPEYKEVVLPSGSKMRFVKIPAEKPYWLGECEVTNAEYKEFDPTHDSRYAEGRNKDRVTRGYPLNYPDQPVCRVSWNRANEFCKWLSEKTATKCSLPTEDEWAFAATAQGGALNIAGAEIVNWNYGRCEKNYKDGAMWSAPVKWGQPNKLGLRHMLGNVCEWTSSDFAPGMKTIKGGSWNDTKRFANPEWKWRYAPYKVIYNVGFRVKMED
jgi:cytochrome c553